MNIPQNHLALIAGSIIVIILLVCSLRKDPQLCLARKRNSVILVLNFEVCKAEQSESEMDGHPSTIDHPPKKEKDQVINIKKSLRSPGDFPGFFLL